MKTLNSNNGTIEEDETKRKYVKQENNTKIISSIPDKRPLDEQVKELRSIVRSLTDTVANYGAIPIDSIPVCINQNPKKGTLGDWVKKYNDEGDLKNGI